MKYILLPITGALLLAACDARVTPATPVVERNTTVVNPPAKEEKKVENNTTIVNPPAREEKKIESNTTIVNPPAPPAPPAAPPQ